MQPMEQISDEKTDPIYFLLNLHAPEGHHEKRIQGVKDAGRLGRRGSRIT